VTGGMLEQAAARRALGQARTAGLSIRVRHHPCHQVHHHVATNRHLLSEAPARSTGANLQAGAVYEHT
jgi:hypothetical protein